MLLKYAEKLLALSEEAISAIKSSSVHREFLKVGSMESAAVSFVPHLLSKFHSENPEVKVSVLTGNSKFLVNKLLRREIDCAFVAGSSEHSDLVSVNVKKEKLVLLTDVTKNDIHNVRQLLSLPLIVFPYGCSYRQIFENWLNDENIIANQIMEFSSLGSIIASVSAGLGIALLPMSAVNIFSVSGSLLLHEVPEKYRFADVKFIYRKNQWNDVALNSITQILENHG